MIKKPEKPTKKIVQKNSVTYDFNWVSKKVSLDSFLEWCKESIPKSARSVTLELREDWEYDDCFTYLELEWEETVDNTNYSKDIEKYKKKLAKWNKQ